MLPPGSPDSEDDIFSDCRPAAPSQRMQKLSLAEMQQELPIPPYRPPGMQASGASNDEGEAWRAARFDRAVPDEEYLGNINVAEKTSTDAEPDRHRVRGRGKGKRK